MLWVLVDVAVVVLAMGFLVWSAVRLWRVVKALGKDVSAAGERVAVATAALEAAQARAQAHDA